VNYSVLVLRQVPKMILPSPRYLFMAYLTTLSVAQTTSRRTVQFSMKDEPEMMWREAVMICFKVLSRNSREETE
jgi:hypothetical protein